jgi:AAA domain
MAKIDLNTLPTSSVVRTIFDPASIQARLRINPLDVIHEPPSVLEIVDDSGHNIPSFTRGNFSLLIGKAKSRKTFFSVFLTASFLGHKNNKIQGNPQTKPVVLWFDTEQSQFHLHKTVSRICKLVDDSDPANLQAYALRTLTTAERIQFIDFVISDTFDVGLVIIDGIRDLVNDINSPQEATETATRLMKWTAEYDLHIINVLHQNKGDNNARGHLGAELTNKAETVLSITAEGSLSTVEAEYSREVSFNQFSFTVNDKALPELCDNPEKERENKKSLSPNLIPDDQHLRVLDTIFKRLGDEKPTYKELIDEIIGGFSSAFGETKCRQYISHYLSKMWITKQKDGHKVEYNYERAIF